MTQLAQTMYRRRFAITLDHVWFATALILLALRPLLTPIPPYDFWWHLATGRLIWSHGAIPMVDTFSYTRTGLPFYDQSWLAQLCMYGLYQLGGGPLLVIIQVLVIVLAYGLLLRLCILQTGRSRLSVAVLLLSMLLVLNNWTIRPQSYAFPLFMGFLTVLTEYRLGRGKRLWLLPLLMAVWVNIHGSFMLGYGLIAMTFVGEAIKTGWRIVHQAKGSAPPITNVALTAQPYSVFSVPFMLWSALTLLALVFNPRGLGIIGYVRDLLGNPVVTTYVAEWAPPTIRDMSGAIFFLFLIACGLVFTYARSRPDITNLLLFGVFLWLALGAGRNIVWFGFVAVPLLVAQLATLLPAPGTRRRPHGSSKLNGLLIALLLLLLVIGLPWVKPALLPPAVGALYDDNTPIAAVEALQQQPTRPRHLFHDMGYGSYLIWAAPEQPVFIDPRIELYPYQQWKDYVNLGQGNDVAALLRKYAIDGLLLSKREQAPLIKIIRGDPTWIQQYEDDRSIYFRKRDV